MLPSATLALALAASNLPLVASDQARAFKALLDTRRDAAERSYRLALLAFQDGSGNADTVYRWSRRLLKAHQVQAGRPAALKAHLSRMKDLDKVARELVGAGLVRRLEAEAARYYLAEAEVWQRRGATD